MDVSIDAHAHVFHDGLALAADRRYTPAYEAPLARYLHHLDEAGLSHGVLVQPSFLGTDNSYLVACLERAPDRLRGVAVVAPGASRPMLRGLRAAGVMALRLNLVGRPTPDLARPEWQALLAEAADIGWHVEVQRPAADLRALARPLLDAGLAVVIDHFGLADQTTLAELTAFGRTRRVWVKLSAPYRAGGRAAAHALYPTLREAFGVDRLMWGSDWPHTGFEDSQSYASNRRFLDEFAGDEAAAILAAPRAMYGL